MIILYCISHLLPEKFFRGSFLPRKLADYEDDKIWHGVTLIQRKFIMEQS